LLRGGQPAEKPRRPVGEKSGLAPAAPSPASAAAAATTAAAAAATSAATATATATATAAAAASAPCQLHAASGVFLVEEMEGGEADVGHFLFAKDEALIGQGIAGLRDVDRGRRRCGCAADQRNTQSGGTQRMDGAGLAFSFLPRSLLDSRHGRLLQIFTCSCESARRGERAPGDCDAQELPGPSHAKYLVSSSFILMNEDDALAALRAAQPAMTVRLLRLPSADSTARNAREALACGRANGHRQTHPSGLSPAGERR